MKKIIQKEKTIKDTTTQIDDIDKNNVSKENSKKLSKIRRKNAKLFPIYKMFAWDLLFYYVVSFLFIQ